MLSCISSFLLHIVGRPKSRLYNALTVLLKAAMHCLQTIVGLEAVFLAMPILASKAQLWCE
jgi:hypothetical protein